MLPQPIEATQVSSETRFKIEAQQSLATLVAKRLREAIIDGEFALGAMIPEETLAASFGVSRTPVREALNQLQLLGLVTVRPLRGSYVFEASEADVAALCQFRCVIEPRAAEMAWRHDRDATTEALPQQKNSRCSGDLRVSRKSNQQLSSGVRGKLRKTASLKFRSAADEFLL